jgi:hypothetical protein
MTLDFEIIEKENIETLKFPPIYHYKMILQLLDKIELDRR